MRAPEIKMSNEPKVEKKVRIPIHFISLSPFVSKWPCIAGQVLEHAAYLRSRSW